MHQTRGSRPATPFLDEALFAPPSVEAYVAQLRPDVVAWTEAYDDEGVPVRLDHQDPQGAAIGAMTAVTDTTRTPWRWICSIATQREVTKVASGRIEQGGLSPSGTGLLISPRHVLTAAHVLRSVERDGSGTIVERHTARVVEVSPGRNGDDRPFGKVGFKQWAVHPKWNPEDADSVFDLALITLDGAVGARTFASLAGQPLGWWGRDANEAALPQMPPALVEALVGTRGMTAGYARNDNARMSSGSAALATIVPAEGLAQQRAKRLGAWLQSPRRLALPVAADKGHSGAPVWVGNGNKRWLVGVLTTKVEGGGAQAVVVNAGAVQELRALAGMASKASGPGWFAPEVPAGGEGAAVSEPEQPLEASPLEASPGESPIDEALFDEALFDEALLGEALFDEALLEEALRDEVPIDEAAIPSTDPEAL